MFRLNCGMLLFVLAVAALGEQAPSGCAAQSEALAELRKLRVEILEYRIESRVEALAGLEQDLQRIRGERQRLQEDERARIEQLAEVEGFLSTQGHTLTPEQRTHFEAMKAGIVGEQPEKLRTEQAAIMKREAEAADRLRAVQQQVQSLEAKRNELTAR